MKGLLVLIYFEFGSITCGFGSSGFLLKLPGAKILVFNRFLILYSDSFD
jgi:hypothetical protein